MLRAMLGETFTTSLLSSLRLCCGRLMVSCRSRSSGSRTVLSACSCFMPCTSTGKSICMASPRELAAASMATVAGSLPAGRGPPVHGHLPLGGNGYFPYGGVVRSGSQSVQGGGIAGHQAQAVVFQGDGNAGLHVLVRPVADDGTEHDDVLFHEEAGRLHADHEVLRRQEFRGSLPYLQGGGDHPGSRLPRGQVVRHVHRNGDHSFFVRCERAAPLDAVRKVGAQLNRGGGILLSGCRLLSSKGIRHSCFTHCRHGWRCKRR